MPTNRSVTPEMKHATKAGLHYVSADSPGYRRLRRGKNFIYENSRGKRVRDERTLERIRKLAIPPAYEEVWVSADPKGHLQVTGKDARGRKQYRYHAKWTEARGLTKYQRILQFAKVLPKIRARTSADLKLSGLPREKVLAAVVQLLEKTLIRVGSEEYARENDSYGLATMKNRHVDIRQKRIVFKFKGKSNIHHEIGVIDGKLAKIVKLCRAVPGQRLFQYVDDDGGHHEVRSQDVNLYLKALTDEDYTAKDFRTWAGTVLAAVTLRTVPQGKTKAETKRLLNQAIDTVAGRLGNTRSVCRKCYIHPAIIDAYLEGEVLKSARAAAAAVDVAVVDFHALNQDEKQVAAFLKRRIRQRRR